MQTDQNICMSLEYSMTVKLLTEHYLEFLCLTGGCTGSSESTLVKMPHCWKSRVVAHILSSCDVCSLSSRLAPVVKLNYAYSKVFFH